MTVTADRVKPAHIERTPEDEQTRQSTAMSKNTAIRPMAKIHEPQTTVVGKKNTATPTPSEAHEPKFERTVYGKDKGNSSRG